MFGFTSTSKLLRPLVEIRRTIGVVGVFSAVINLMMLTGPVFMLQVYDRVLISGSVITLAVFFVLSSIVTASWGYLMPTVGGYLHA